MKTRFSNRTALVAVAALAALGVVAAALRESIVPALFAPTGAALPVAEPAIVDANDGTPASNTDAPDTDTSGIRTVATGLDTPWEIAPLPDGRLLVTERPGTLVVVGTDGTVVRHPVPGVEEIGEGGLLGMALHPDYATSGLVYLYGTYRSEGSIKNRIRRFRLTDAGLQEESTILDGIPGSQYHDGGRIAFGPDGMLYVTTGDAGDTAAAQSTDSLAGKILRIDRDGGIPADNPFGNAVWSYGHRNVQGIAWDGTGRMWATEHGRSGAASGLDELNLIVRGGNYGWPTIQGDARREGMIPPVRHSGEKETWAPAGIAAFSGKLYFAGLRGSSLYEASPDPDGGAASLRALLRREYGRLRAVATDGKRLYVSISNRDGRGTPGADDDRILSLSADYLAAFR